MLSAKMSEEGPAEWTQLRMIVCDCSSSSARFADPKDSQPPARAELRVSMALPRGPATSSSTAPLPVHDSSVCIAILAVLHLSRSRAVLGQHGAALHLSCALLQRVSSSQARRMLRRAARLAVLARSAPPLQRRFCAAPPPLLRASADGATACRALAPVAPGEAPAFAVFASRRTLEALGGAPGFVDLPPCEAQLAQGRPFAMLESAAGRVVLAAPLSGEVLRRNEALLAQGGAGEAPLRPGTHPLWLLDLACADEAEWEALQPTE